MRRAFRGATSAEGNTGPSLSPEQTPNLFQRIYCAHGGDVILFSADAEWTVFLLALPVA
jgi:hypothetical protein